jgi:hypothetical protein
MANQRDSEQWTNQRDSEQWTNQRWTMKHGSIKNLPAKSFPVILSEASFFARERTCGVQRPPNTAAFPSPPQGPISLAAKSFPVILSDASSSLAKEVAESKDAKTAGFPSPP